MTHIGVYTGMTHIGREKAPYPRVREGSLPTGERRFLPTMVYTTLCIQVYLHTVYPPYHPGYTTIPPHAVTGLHHGYTGRSVCSDEALGSVKEESPGWEPLRHLWSSIV